MGFTFSTQRALVTQQLISFGLTVPGAGNPVPIGSVMNLDKSKLITTFVISNPVAGSSVYLGNAGVTAAGANQGLEIQPGTAPEFAIEQEGRQLYEIQPLLGLILEKLNCVLPNYEKIPFIVWDLQQLFLFSANAAGSQVTIGAFPQAYL